MKKSMGWLFSGLLLLAPCPAGAEWVDLSRNLGETDIRAVAVDAKDARTLYAASEKRVYRSTDAGARWNQTLSVRGADNRIHFILVDPKESRRVFVASERGIQVSQDAGKSWKYFYRGMGNNTKAVYSLSPDLDDPAVLWAGTSGGLVKISHEGRDAKIIGGVPSVKIFSILVTREAGSKVLWVATEKGIYKSTDSGVHWDRVFVEMGKTREDAQEASLSQFQIEELSAAPAMANMIRLPGKDVLLAASSRGVWEGLKNGGDWAELKNSRLPDQKINYLAGSAQAFYAATDRGVFRWEENGKAFKDISDGLASREVRMLVYDEGSNDLFAATRKGVFRYPNPDFKPEPAAPPSQMPAAREILRRFESEPGIGEIQNAAIRYAEVHPDKIKAWREAASKKALVPTLSFTTDSTADQNVDIDRGGTNDPDRFIIGPKEEQTDWHVGLSWDLGELIWNNDQTSIDTRSRLMVELRDDVLNEVTHLYYERRRLQVEIFMTPAKELPLEVERQLKLDELTAGIDALTGGYLSRRLSEAPHVRG